MMRYFNGVLGAVILLIVITRPLDAQDFSHPGVLHKASDFARMRQKVAEKAEPWYTAWNNLLAASEAQLSWNPRPQETVIRGGSGDNISVLYRDVISAYEHALIYNINGDTDHGDKAVQILNAWSKVHKYVSGNADRYLGAGLFGYQFANAAEMMRDYPGFELERFKQYMLDVFYYPMNERFVLSNEWGRAHNDAVATNYRVNWDICNMNAMLAISILCDNRENFNKTIEYAKSGDGNGNIHRAVNFIHSDILGQWEESGRDQGHTMGGLVLYGLFCEIAWNQGVDMYGYDDSRFRKGAEYVARYNTWDSEADAWKYENLPYSTYTFQQGPLYNPRWTTESALSGAVRGKYGSGWAMIYNHYVNRIGTEAEKVQGITDILQQQPSIFVPSVAAHADTYDTPGVGALTFTEDSGACLYPWLNMDIDIMSIAKRPKYGSAKITAENDDSIYTINASGTGIGSNSDRFHYLYQTILDNGEIVARVTGLEGSASKAQAGIMIREKLNQKSKYAFLNLTPDKGVVFSTRTSDGAVASEEGTNGANTLPYWLKLTKRTDTIAAYISSDKAAWTKVGEKVISMESAVSFGMAVTAGDDDSICTATFEQVEITQGNILPIVKLTGPIEDEINYISPANIFVEGVVADGDGTITKAELLLDDEVYAELSSGEIETYLTGLEEGEYELFIRATDNDGAMAESDRLKITVSIPTETLPYYTYDKLAGSYALDVSGNLRHSKLSGGPVLEDGKVDKALAFDGVDDYATILQCPFEQLSEFSFSSWIFLNSQDTWSRIFDVGDGTGSYMFLTPVGGKGTVKFQILADDGRRQSVEAQMAVPTKKWYHVAVTLKDNQLVIYLNGIVIAKETNFLLRPYDLGLTTQNYIGKSQWSSDPYLNASLDEVRFFNYGLSQDEVKQLKDGTFTAVANQVFGELQVTPSVSKETFKAVFVNAPGLIEVFDLTGHNLLTKVASGIQENISIKHNGIYLIKLTEGEKTKAFKVVKVN